MFLSYFSLVHILVHLHNLHLYFLGNFPYDGFLTDFSSSQYMTYGRFTMGSHAQIETPTRQDQKCLVLPTFSYWDATAPKNKLYPVKQVFIYKNQFVDKYIYIYILSSSVVSQLFSVAKHVGRLKLRSKPTQLYGRLSIIPLSQQANHANSGIIRH